MRFYINTSVPHQKVADHVKKEGNSVKGNNMSKSVRHHMYDLYVEIVLKHAEQTEQL
jgi:hypothetical protein